MGFKRFTMTKKKNYQLHYFTEKKTTKNIFVQRATITWSRAADFSF